MNDFARPTGIDWGPGGHTGMVKFGEDSQALVVFYTEKVQNMFKSQAAGRPIFENQVYIRIQHPGENYNIIQRPATDDDKRRYAQRWSQFLNNQEQVPEGTPIDLLFPNNPAFAANLRAQGIYTIDQLSKLGGNAIDGLGRGGQNLVERAQKYMESANKGIKFHEWQKKEEELRQAIKLLDQQNAQLRKELTDFMKSMQMTPRNSLSPPYIPGYDPQTERINANHITSDIARQKGIPGSTIQVGGDAAADLVIDAIPEVPHIPEGFELK